MSTLSDIAKIILNMDQDVIENIGFDQFLLFVNLCSHLYPQINIGRHSKQPLGPPTALSLNMVQFLTQCLSYEGQQVEGIIIEQLWDALSEPIWKLGPREAPKHLVPLFLRFGTPLGIGFVSVLPPHMTCDNLQCSKYGKVLKEPSTFSATIFTLEYGPLPCFPVSLYCRRCHTRYHNNYFIHDNAKSRTYYPGSLPRIIQLSTHFFMTSSLCELFANMMMMAWVPATNCARIYNLALGQRDEQLQNMLGWEADMHMNMENVWNGFFIHSFLLDAQSLGLDALRHIPFTLPHMGANHRSNHLDEMLKNRNDRFSGYLRPHYNHACDDCAP